MHNFVYYSYQISFLLCFSIYKKKNHNPPFLCKSVISDEMESMWLWKAELYLLPLILTSSSLPPPSEWRLFSAPPLPHSHAKWMAQMPLDKTVPLGLLPLTIRSAWGPQTCFLIVVSPQPLPPLRADRHRERREMGRPRATKSEGRRHRSDKPCLRIMKKTSCWTIFPEQGADRTGHIMVVDRQSGDFGAFWGNGWCIEPH